jgi:hypothetical protein
MISDAVVGVQFYPTEISASDSAEENPQNFAD